MKKVNGYSIYPYLLHLLRSFIKGDTRDPVSEFYVTFVSSLSKRKHGYFIRLCCP